MKTNASKTKTRKILSLIGIILGSLVILLFIVGIIIEGIDPTSPIGAWVKDNVWDISEFPKAFQEHLKTIIQSIILIVFIFALSSILRIIFHKMMKKSNRAKTVITLLDGIIKYGAAITLIFLVLQAFGVNTAAIWESVGILTLIVGLGAQSLIADIIAGIFIIFENEYSVGEIVSIDDFRGTVSEIGIRATKIIDCAGNIKMINNSDIKNVVNLSRELSLAVVDCEFGYDIPLEFVENLIKNNLEKFKENIPGIVDGPYYKGVSGYGASNVAIKLVAKCDEEDRYQVQRDLLREYRQLFVKNGFDLSYDQVVINQPSETNIKVNKKQEQAAREFVNEQKELSKNIEEQEMK